MDFHTKMCRTMIYMLLVTEGELQDILKICEEEEIVCNPARKDSVSHTVVLVSQRKP